MKKCFLFFGNICAIISGVIGAGFATGEELFVYFKGESALFVGICCSVFFFLFFILSANLYDKSFDSKNKFVKFYKIFLNLFSLLSCFVVLSAMLAGAKSVVALLFNNVLISSVIVLFIVLFSIILVVVDLKGLQTVGVFFVPIMLVCILIIAVKNPLFVPFSEVRGNVFNCMFYVSLNSIFLTTLISKSCANYSKKTKILFCLISSLVCGVLVFVGVGCVVKLDLSLPLVRLAYFDKGFGIFYCILVLIGIVTTVCASAVPMVNFLDKKVDGRFVSTLMVFAFAWLVSLFDFSKIIEKCYPVLSIIGIILIFLGVVMLLINSNLKNRKNHPCHRIKSFSNNATK